MMTINGIVYLDPPVICIICEWILILHASFHTKKTPSLRILLICLAGLLFSLAFCMTFAFYFRENILWYTIFHYLTSFVIWTICLKYAAGHTWKKSASTSSFAVILITLLFRLEEISVWPVYYALTGKSFTALIITVPITSKMTMGVFVFHIIRMIETVVCLPVWHAACTGRFLSDVRFDRIWAFLTLAIFLIIGITESYLAHFVFDDTAQRTARLLLFCVVAGLFTGIIVHCRMLTAKVREDNLRSLNQIQNSQMETMFEQFISASEKHYIISRLRTLQAYIESGSMEKAETYLQESVTDFDSGTFNGRYTENVFVNMVLAHIRQKYPTIMIHSECTCAVSSTIDHTDFGMLLLNALEARAETILADSEEPVIQLKIGVYKEMLVIIIGGNVFADGLSQNLSNNLAIRHILEKYDGSAEESNPEQYKIIIPLLP